MIGLPLGGKVWIATGHMDMRKGLIRLVGMVNQSLLCDPMSGHLFVLGGRLLLLERHECKENASACLEVNCCDSRLKPESG